ncbi:hypothetical protein CSUI_007915, partial [Cystoisospora suis]
QSALHAPARPSCRRSGRGGGGGATCRAKSPRTRDSDRERASDHAEGRIRWWLLSRHLGRNELFVVLIQISFSLF